MVDKFLTNKHNIFQRKENLFDHTRGDLNLN